MQSNTISPCMECSKQVVREEEYNLVGTIGKGSFGSVILVEGRHTLWRMFAMKVINDENTVWRLSVVGSCSPASGL